MTGNMKFRLIFRVLVRFLVSFCVTEVSSVNRRFPSISSECFFFFVKNDLFFCELEQFFNRYVVNMYSHRLARNSCVAVISYV